MVWINSRPRCSKRKAILKKKGEHMMGDSEEDTPYLHIKHLGPGPIDQAARREGTKAEKQGNNSSFKDVKQNRLSLTFLFVSLCINITIVTYMCLTNKGSTDGSFVPISTAALSTSVCILCTSIGLSVNDGAIHMPDNIDVIMVNNSKMCCLKNSKDLKNLITLFSTQYSQDDLSSATQGTAVDRTQYGAHLFLDSIALKDNKLVWTDEYGFGSAYVGRGVDMVNGSYRIKQDGCYFVYSFMTFKSRESHPENYNIVHTVSRYNTKLKEVGNQLLLMRKQSLAKKSETFSTSCLGASLVLRAGDEIFVEVNFISAVYAFAPSNYFGLFRLRC